MYVSAPAANRIKRSLLSLLYILYCARFRKGVKHVEHNIYNSNIIHNDECSIHREMISATLLQGYMEGFGFGHNGLYLPTIVRISVYVCAYYNIICERSVPKYAAVRVVYGKWQC